MLGVQDVLALSPANQARVDSYVCSIATDGRSTGQAPRRGGAPGEQEPADLVSRTGGPPADLRGPGTPPPHFLLHETFHTL